MKKKNGFSSFKFPEILSNFRRKDNIKIEGVKRWVVYYTNFERIID